MEMSANPVDVAIYVGMVIGSVIVLNKLLTGFASSASNIISGGSAAGASTGTASLGSTLVTTMLTATSVVGGTAAAHTVSTEILEIDPPPIVEEYFSGESILDDNDCSWSDEIDKKWDIVDLTFTYEIDSGKRRDNPFLVGGTMRFRSNNKFELESDALSFHGKWSCVKGDLLRLDIDLSADEMKRQFGQGFDIPDNIPLDEIGLIAIYSINYQEDVYDFDEAFLLHLRSAGINQSIIDLIDSQNEATSAIPEQLSDIDFSSCDISDIGCWDRVVSQIMAYYAYEIELVRD